MPPRLQDLIAHYLATNYPTVLEPFILASGISPPDPASPPNPDLRTLVEDYVSFQLTSRLGAVALDGFEGGEEPAQDGSWRGWGVGNVMGLKMDEGVKLGGVRRTIDGVSVSNLLTVGVHALPYREFHTGSASYRSEYRPSIIISSVDKSLKVLDYSSGHVEKIIQPHRAAVLSFAVHPTNPRYLLSGSMDGTTVLTDLITQQPLQTFQSAKFVVRVAFSQDGQYLATASYDKHIVLYQASSSALAPPHQQNEDDDDLVLIDDTDSPDLACEPELRYSEIRRISVDSNPEAIVFHPNSTFLLYTLRSSHLLHYVKLDGSWETLTKTFNPHPLDNHVSFSVLNLAIHPSGRVIACQTGDHRGGAGERILIYGIEPEETERLECLWTGSEGDDFVLPRVSWLPDGSGLITTTPNGYLNLVTLSGQVRSSVKIHGSIELGQGTSEVVRDCVVVPVDKAEGDEGSDKDWEVVSVGYDRKVRISR